MATLVPTETIPLETDADGVMRVGQTRVTLDTVVTAFKDGATAEEIAQQYPTVALADVYYVIGYYLRRRDAVEAYLGERRKEADALQGQMEARFNPIGIRERLMARQNSGNQ
jgi:uncharacterized protein (DUF433 family)